MSRISRRSGDRRDRSCAASAAQVSPGIASISSSGSSIQVRLILVVVTLSCLRCRSYRISRAGARAGKPVRGTNAILRLLRCDYYSSAMPHTGNPTVDIILYSIAGIVLLIIGYRVGRWISNVANSKLMAQKEQELFTAQKGFKTLYDQELGRLREHAAKLEDELRLLKQKVEDYRKKAAGFG